MTFLAALFCAGVLAQNIPSNCPAISIETPKSILPVNVAGLFTAKVSGVPTNGTLSFRWAAKMGKVIDDASHQMTFIPGKKDGGANITVFVRVEGLPKGCPDTAAEVVSIIPLLERHPLDEFGTLSANMMKAEMDSLYIILNTNPAYHGFIEIFFDSKESSIKLLSHIKNILAAIKFRKYDIHRITFAIVESSGKLNTKLWTYRSGADLTEDRPTAIFISGSDLEKNPKKALPKRQCQCK
ncbi:MAG: hypothetical protein IPK98_16950 [Chloracidobacterium sp.]|nr:hypothetical protein [Chloracidobacterium sp.]